MMAHEEGMSYPDTDMMMILCESLRDDDHTGNGTSGGRHVEGQIGGGGGNGGGCGRLPASLGREKERPSVPVGGYKPYLNNAGGCAEAAKQWSERERVREKIGHTVMKSAVALAAVSSEGLLPLLQELSGQQQQQQQQRQGTNAGFSALEARNTDASGWRQDVDEGGVEQRDTESSRGMPGSPPSSLTSWSLSSTTSDYSNTPAPRPPSALTLPPPAPYSTGTSDRLSCCGPSCSADCDSYEEPDDYNGITMTTMTATTNRTMGTHTNTKSALPSSRLPLAPLKSTPDSTARANTVVASLGTAGKGGGGACGKKQRQKRRYAAPKASRYCHVCARHERTVSLVACSNVFRNTCQKSVCVRCISEFSLHADRVPWICPHCQDACPPRAKCFSYDRQTQRRRERSLSQRNTNSVVVPLQPRACYRTNVGGPDKEREQKHDVDEIIEGSQSNQQAPSSSNEVATANEVVPQPLRHSLFPPPPPFLSTPAPAPAPAPAPTSTPTPVGNSFSIPIVSIPTSVTTITATGTTNSAALAHGREISSTGTIATSSTLQSLNGNGTKASNGGVTATMLDEIESMRKIPQQYSFPDFSAVLAANNSSCAPRYYE